jgi:cytochrome c2
MDRRELTQFIHAPRKFIPGTKMIFPGIQSKQDRKVSCDLMEEKIDSWRVMHRLPFGVST